MCFVHCVINSAQIHIRAKQSEIYEAYAYFMIFFGVNLISLYSAAVHTFDANSDEHFMSDLFHLCILFG